MQIRNAQQNTEGGQVLSTFDCEILLQGSWLSFTADPNDPEPHGRTIHAAIVANQPFTGELTVDL